MVYTVHKAKTHFSQLLQQAASGREVLIARGRSAKPEFPLARIERAAGTRLDPDPSLARGVRLPPPDDLLAPLPPGEWGDLAR